MQILNGVQHIDSVVFLKMLTNLAPIILCAFMIPSSWLLNPSIWLVIVLHHDVKKDFCFLVYLFTQPWEWVNNIVIVYVHALCRQICK